MNNLLLTLSRILFIWVRTKQVPANAKDELAIPSDAAILYVLPSRSLSDLLVLQHHCRAAKLPLPDEKPSLLKKAGTAAYLYLDKLGWLQPVKRRGPTPPSPFLQVVRRVAEDPTFKCQIVPVTIIWGRNPAKQERSLFKLLFSDDEHAGIIQKLLIVLAQGRDVLINYGKPISLNDLVAEGAPVEETARKLRRVLRVHFRQQRNITIGPSLYHRSQVVETLMNTKPVQAAVDAEVRRSGLSKERVEAKARHYIREIACEQSHAVIRFFDIVLTYIWNKIFEGVEVKHAERLRELNERTEIVYLPTHRSHVDYLLIAYAIYYLGLSPPHIAAGINLNFWPVGPLLRRACAFFLRRSFKGNRLYTVVFNEYVHYLLTKGHSVSVFLEGGRSRTGRTLQPKTGMLSMAVHSYLRDSNRDMVFVPVYIGYDSVVEVKSYLKELRGGAKSAESARQLLKARRILQKRYGKAYMGFGEPIRLQDYLDQKAPSDWRSAPVGSDSKPDWMGDVVDELALESMSRANSAAVVSPVCLFALALLSTPSRAMTEEDLVACVAGFINLQKARPYDPSVVMPEGSVQDMLNRIEKFAPITRFAHAGGDVIFLGELDGTLMSYYRNNILHLFAMPSLVASFFQHRDQVLVSDLLAGCRQVFPFLQAEFFLKWQEADLEGVVLSTIDALVGQGLLKYDVSRTRLSRPNVADRAFTIVRVLGKGLGPVLERYSISAALLARALPMGSINRDEFELTCQQMAQRVSLLSGMTDPEYFDKSLFKKYIDMLKGMGYLRVEADNQLRIDPKIMSLAEHSMGLLSTDIIQTIHRTSSAPAAVDKS